MIEKEIKILLNKEQYDFLMQQFDWDEVRTQTNFYYTDNKNYIDKEGITIRVRACNHKAVLQIKVPVDERGALHIKREFETDMEDVPEDIEGTFLSELCSISLPDVSMAGFLVTERSICNWKEGIEISLDKNKYLDAEDYEIEIEYKEELDSAIVKFLEDNDIKIQKKVEGKCRRFFNQLEKR